MTQNETVLLVQPEAPPKDHPFQVILEAVAKHSSQGRLCYQKYTCAGCGQRLMIEKPNVFYKTAKCEECSHLTDIEKQGCNYLLEMHNKTLEQVARVMEGKENS